jgi:hypothetical protein
MADLVFILGAGASKAAGAPVMTEFLDAARDLYDAGSLGPRAEEFSTVFAARSKLSGVHSKADLDIQNVESVFSAFEMLRTLKRTGDYGVEDPDDLVTAMKWLIAFTIERRLLLRVGEALHFGSRRPAARYEARQRGRALGSLASQHRTNATFAAESRSERV